MNSRQRRMTLILAIPGVAACLFAVAAFLLDFLHNRIPWRPILTHRDQYLVIGKAYSAGFFVGFFFCFFLMLIAVAVGTWYEQRRARREVVSARR